MAVLLAIVVPSASAVIVTGPHGQRISIAPSRVGTPSGFEAPPIPGKLLYHSGGPVLHSTTEYALFWDPGNAFTTAYKNAVTTYMTDVANDSGNNGNVYAVATQYGDSTSDAFYNVTFGGAFTDTTAYPANGCSDTLGNGTPLAICLTDAQLQTKIHAFAVAHSIPANLSHEIFIYTPQGVGSCFDNTSSECTYTAYCAYHGVDGDGNTYANEPYGDDSGCIDGSVVYPTSTGAAGPTLGTISHEANETITDPQLNAWFDSGGNEDGDKCAYHYGTTQPASGGGVYNQTINGHQYLTQQEWSNGADPTFANGCLPQPSSTVTGAFTASTSTTLTANFTDSSTDTDGSSAFNDRIWDFGDGHTLRGAGNTAPSHTYASAGTYTVTETLVDHNGYTVVVSHSVKVPGTPLITTDAASSVTASGASLNSTINPEGSDTTYKYEYGTSTSFGTVVPASGTLDAGSGTTAQSQPPQPITGLSAHTTYYYRVCGNNAANPGIPNQVCGAVVSFTTSGTPTAPAVVTGSASAITSSGATLSGTVNPEGQNTAFTFEYGTSTSFGHITTIDNAGNYGGVENVSLPVSGLQPHTTYFYRLVGANATGTTNGAVMSFTTSGTPTAPAVVTGSASAITSSGATLSGTVNPEGQNTVFTFEYGTSTSFGHITTVDNAGNYGGAENVSLPVSGLQPNTTYLYRLVASNATGTTNGTVQSFQTGP